MIYKTSRYCNASCSGTALNWKSSWLKIAKNQFWAARNFEVIFTTNSCPKIETLFVKTIGLIPIPFYDCANCSHIQEHERINHANWWWNMIYLQQKYHKKSAYFVRYVIHTRYVLYHWRHWVPLFALTLSCGIYQLMLQMSHHFYWQWHI